jgi:hypothetical protein
VTAYPVRTDRAFTGEASDLMVFVALCAKFRLSTYSVIADPTDKRPAHYG